MVVPAVAGPLDLGTVVVRQAISVNPDDAHVTVASDPFPSIVGGIPLRLRRLAVTVDRPDFLVNPTNCDPLSIGAVVTSTSGSQATVSSPFHASGCDKLAFSPKLAMKFTGGRTHTKKGTHPGLVATVTPVAGQANIKTTTVTLPASITLDANNLPQLCAPADAQKRACPASSAVGSAKVTTPLVNGALTGPVYLVSGGAGGLPSLLAALSGPINISVHADSAFSGKHIQTKFTGPPGRAAELVRADDQRRSQGHPRRDAEPVREDQQPERRRGRPERQAAPRQRTRRGDLPEGRATLRGQVRSAARSPSVSAREPRACGSHATITQLPARRHRAVGQHDVVGQRDALGADPLDAHDDLDVLVVVAHLAAVVELDAHQHEREPGRVAQRREQRAAPLLQQLVVDGLVEVPEHVHVAPAQADARPGLGAQAGTCASIAAAERSTSSGVVAQFETEIRSARRPRHSVALAQHVPSSLDPRGDAIGRLVAVAEAHEHLVEDDVVEDLGARVGAEDLARTAPRGRTCRRRAARRRGVRASRSTA